LRNHYVRWQKEIPNASILVDKEKVIENLIRQIASLSMEISTLRSQPVTTVNTQEYDIKIRTLNSRIQVLESQLRTQRVDYEGQLRPRTKPS
jgi:hypothetical protein